MAAVGPEAAPVAEAVPAEAVEVVVQAEAAEAAVPAAVVAEGEEAVVAAAVEAEGEAVAEAHPPE